MNGDDWGQARKSQFGMIWDRPTVFCHTFRHISGLDDLSPIIPKCDFRDLTPAILKLVTSFQVGDWQVQPSLNRLSRGGEEVRLEPKVMQVLECLAAKPGDVVTRDELVAQVWPGVFVTDDVLHRAIRELRRAFGDETANPTYIETIRKRGYRLISPSPSRDVDTPRASRLRVRYRPRQAGGQDNPRLYVRRWPSASSPSHSAPLCSPWPRDPSRRRLRRAPCDSSRSRLQQPTKAIRLRRPTAHAWRFRRGRSRAASASPTSLSPTAPAARRCR